MTSRDGRQATHVELPTETLEALEEEKSRTGKSLWELLDQGARMVVPVDDTTEQALERRLEKIEQDKQRLQEEIAQRQEELSELETKADNVETKLTELRERQSTIEELYNEILATLEANPGQHIYACKSTLDEIATREYGRPTESNVESVIIDIQEYCDTNSIDIADHRIDTTTAGVGVGQTHVQTDPQAADGGETFLQTVDGKTADNSEQGEDTQ
jgi:seryl-tRNA synthetase